jgi:hypothetical protein
MAECPFEAPMDIARGLRELAAFMRNCGFPQAAQLIDAASVAVRKQITPIMERADRSVAAKKSRPIGPRAGQVRFSPKAAQRQRAAE